jgi:hypothetical protein
MNLSINSFVPSWSVRKLAAVLHCTQKSLRFKNTSVAWECHVITIYICLHFTDFFLSFVPLHSTVLSRLHGRSLSMTVTTVVCLLDFENILFLASSLVVSSPQWACTFDDSDHLCLFSHLLISSVSWILFDGFLASMGVYCR